MLHFWYTALSSKTTTFFHGSYESCFETLHSGECLCYSFSGGSVNICNVEKPSELGLEDVFKAEFVVVLFNVFSKTGPFA